MEWLLNKLGVDPAACMALVSLCAEHLCMLLRPQATALLLRLPAAGKPHFRCTFQLPAEYSSLQGDGENDVQMLQLVGLGVAVANAGALALQVADAYTASNAEDGVAQAVERFVLGPRGLL